MSVEARLVRNLLKEKKRKEEKQEHYCRQVYIFTWTCSLSHLGIIFNKVWNE